MQQKCQDLFTPYGWIPKESTADSHAAMNLVPYFLTESIADSTMHLIEERRSKLTMQLFQLYSNTTALRAEKRRTDTRV